MVRSSMPLLLALFLTGCAHGPLSLVALDGSQTNDLSKVAVVMEDRNRPVLLRGLDGVPIGSMRVPGAFGDYAYVMRAGTHLLWAKGAPYAHPLIPQRIRCYVLHVELAPGGRYLLKEDVEAKKALLLVAATGEVQATGELVDEPWVFASDCKWD